MRSDMLTGLCSPSPILVSLPLHFGQDVIQSPQFWGDGVNLDPDSVRVRPRHPGPVQGLNVLPLSPDVGETPNSAWHARPWTVRLHGDLAVVRRAVLRSLQSLLQLALQQLVSSLQFVDFGEEAPESQVERLQHMDVGAQVISQVDGGRDAAPGTGRRFGEK